MVLTRRQLRETYHLEKGAVRKMPGWQEDGDLTFATEEAADARQLFLTERVVERRLGRSTSPPTASPARAWFERGTLVSRRRGVPCGTGTTCAP